MKWIVKWGPFEWTEKTKADALMRVKSVIRERGAFRAYVTVHRIKNRDMDFLLDARESARCALSKARGEVLA